MSACDVRRLITEVVVGGSVSAKVSSSKYSYTECSVGCAEAHLAKRTQRDGREVMVLQCAGCGRQIDSVSRAYAQQLQAQGAAVTTWDEHLAGTMDRLGAERVAFVRSELALRETERRARYNEYINSPQWRAKRRAVLQRDNHRCKGCGEREASHVHHLTYAHLGDELLFELVSLCVPCHEKIHPHMREDES